MPVLLVQPTRALQTWGQPSCRIEWPVKEIVTDPTRTGRRDKVEEKKNNRRSHRLGTERDSSEQTIDKFYGIALVVGSRET